MCVATRCKTGGRKGSKTCLRTRRRAGRPAGFGGRDAAPKYEVCTEAFWKRSWPVEEEEHLNLVGNPSVISLSKGVTCFVLFHRVKLIDTVLFVASPFACACHH